MEALYDYIIEKFTIDGTAALRMIDAAVKWAADYYTVLSIDGREVLSDTGVDFLDAIFGDGLGIERAEIIEQWKEA